ncbi:MAG TPA: ABC-F family ATP-binding cassette domain-containing protein, partial [Thermotogota bacterium]|nr:ABC-F family ATP-binding cassette domain-containing protein [Thermotogota bacterium]
MSLLEIKELSHGFGDKQLYRNATLALNKGEKMGIVGHNGSGKSTLIKICTGSIIPDSGQIIRHPKVRLGYLDQYAMIDRNLTIRQFLNSAFKELFEIEERLLSLYEDFSDNPVQRKKMTLYQEYLETHNFYTIETEIERAANNLGLTAIGMNKKISEISGGQRAKVILAKLLLEKPDILLLDEPTNFLDKNHINWLTEYLAGIDQGFMIVSHDHEFLERISNCICDIENGEFRKYPGNFSDFLRLKDHHLEDYHRRYDEQQRYIRKTEEFIRRNIAGIKSKNAKGRRKQLNRLERLAPPVSSRKAPVFAFNTLTGTHEPLQVRKLSIGYTHPLLKNLEFKVKAGQKIAITGFNGIGKSTLLKTLIGELTPLSGHCLLSDKIAFNYYAQELVWADPELTPLETVSSAYPMMQEKEIRSHLARCGILKEHMQQPIRTLSGGEQTKVKLCLMTLSPSNFLIMDEPTNHLDLKAKESLKEAFSRFEGSIILVSHEESFYKDWVD